MTYVVSLARRRIGLPHRLLLAALLAGLGDWLFYGWDPGISVAIFFLALAACAVAAIPVHASARRFHGACAMLGLSLLPMIEGLNALSFLFGLFGSLLFVLTISGAWPRARQNLGKLLISLACVAPFRIIPDMISANESAHRRGSRWFHAKGVIGALITLTLGAIFVWLLSAANPLIARFLDRMADRESMFFSVPRVSIWVLLILAAWIFVGFPVWRYRKLWHRSPGTPDPSRIPAKQTGTDGVLAGAGALTFALALFNLIFAVQTVSDALYLWGSATLPEGVTYAHYAHRGSYALLAAAILAAGFMLIAMRKGGEGENSFIIRGLLYVWIGQNIALVCSAILRLDLYVQAYSLTMLRVAAFIWMGLVVLGFILIALRVFWHRSNEWLVLMNAMAAIGVLYICCFVNFPAVITNYNVSVAKTAPVNPFAFDFVYAQRLGPRAYPAIDRFLRIVAGKIEACYQNPSQQKYRATCDSMESAYQKFVTARNQKASRALDGNRNWRAWSYGDKRALDYLGRNPMLQPVRFSETRQ